MTGRSRPWRLNTNTNINIRIIPQHLLVRRRLHNGNP